MKAIIADRPNAKLDPDVLLGQIKSFEDFMFTPSTRGKPIGYQAPADWNAAVVTLQKVDLLQPGVKAQDLYTNALFDQAVYDRIAEVK